MTRYRINYYDENDHLQETVVEAGDFYAARATIATGLVNWIEETTDEVENDGASLEASQSAGDQGKAPAPGSDGSGPDDPGAEVDPA
jgi:hypothetical protein